MSLPVGRQVVSFLVSEVPDIPYFRNQFMVNTPQRPIGIFDSGIGGLTVAHAISRLMPNEKLIYFGDTAHLPYGEKSPQAIRAYSSRIAEFLLEKNCKAVIITCNTASASAFNVVKKQVGSKAPVFNVIDPVVRHVTRHHSGDMIGVIGTKGTINSRVYVRKIQAIDKKLKVASMATPLLAPMIEEGYFNNYISRTIIHSYLNKKHFEKVNALILGCTHYPLIKKEVREFYGPRVDILDSAEIVAKAVKERLSKQKLLTASTRPPAHQFYVSDFTESFEKSARMFFKGNIQLKKVKIWSE